MKQPERNLKQIAPLAVRLTAAAAALLSASLLIASPAPAAYEQVGTFAGSAVPVKEENFTEEVQLGGVGGMAVNYTGAAGVPAGTVYAATRLNAGEPRVAMYSPTLDKDLKSGLKFSLSWDVMPLEEPYERCGPALGTKCQLRVKDEPGKVDVDVDQTTGNVFVYNETKGTGIKVIIVYTPDGSEEIARFGEQAPSGVTTAGTPDKIHNSPFPGAIAVNGAGEVYIFDLNNTDNFYHRLMKFVPKVPGKYDEYEYAGTAEDIGAGFGSAGGFPAKPVIDGDGNIYVTSKEASIEAYDPASPGEPPVCTFGFAKGGIAGVTVNPESGEVFFFSYKLPKRLYKLGPCDEVTGEFEGGIVEEIEVAPERDDLWGLAFDPVRKFSPARPPGVLYGGAPNPVSSSGVGVGQPSQSSLGYIFAQAEENPPQVKSEPASHVTASSAQLHAEVDPKGFQTDYVFQYITEAAYQEAGESFAGAAEAPPGGAPLAGTGAAESVGATLVGLSADTAYRYRAVATSHCAPSEPEKVCEGIGTTRDFHTFPLEAAGLVDNRAYELVSPTQKSGGQVLPADPRISSCGAEADCKPGVFYEHFPMQSTPDGEAVVYEGTAFAPGEGATIENQYLARRDAKAGWQTANLTPPLLQKEGGQGYKAFDAELSQAVLAQSRPTLSPQAPPEYQNLYSQPVADPLALSPLVAAEPTGRPATGTESFKVIYAGASADLSRVFFAANDALTAETTFAPAAVDGGPTKFNLYEWERQSGRLRLVNVMPGNAATEVGGAFGVGSAHSISEDGSRAFWSDAAGQLYVRENAEATREIPDPGKFLSAALDGSKVLLSNGRIYDLEEETTTDLAEGKGGFEGIAGQSEDLSRVYFVDTEVLTGEEENSEGQKAQPAEFNLYAWEEGTTRYAATLAAQDNKGANLTLSRSWSPFPSSRTAQASPQGRYLAFLSEAPLMGYDTTGPCESDHKGGLVDAPCPEVFLYDSETGELTCPSCNPSGARPLGFSTLRRIKGPNSIEGPEWLSQPRYLTDSGRLYFDSQDSLSLADTNDGVEDVYQYEPDGVGDCKREGGCVSLISAGREAVDSNLLAIDATGKNVFFTTRDPLLQRDRDELIDLYVAREDGGIAAETETTRSECQGETCQPAAFAPNDPTPGSSSFKGTGNVKQGAPKLRCPKGRRQVRRKGKVRCVNRKRARAVNHNRGGAK